jgi:hypothetical protein
MKQSAQNGFAVLEALLIVVILAIIGGTGYFVWHAKQNTDKSLSDTANSQPAISKPSKQTSDGSADTTKGSVKYLVIKEWGVKFPYPGDDTLSYKIDVSPDSATIISANLAKQYPGCDQYGAGNLGRGHANDSVDEGDQTLGQLYQSDPSLIGKVGDYYYAFGHDQAACANNPTDASARDQNNANDLVKAIVSKAQAD